MWIRFKEMTVLVVGDTLKPVITASFMPHTRPTRFSLFKINSNGTQ